MPEISVDTCSYGSPEFELCKDIRYQVFCEEQGYTVEGEFDDLDRECMHLLVRVDNMSAATARCYYDESQTDILKARVMAGRICILPTFRGFGLGRALMAAIEQHFPADEYRLHAQVSKQGFYEKCGYTTINGEVDADEGVPHIWMHKLVGM